MSLNCISPPAPDRVTDPSHNAILSRLKTLYQAAVPVPSTGIPVRPIAFATASPSVAWVNAGLDRGTVASLVAGVGAAVGPDGLGAVYMLT